MNKPIAKKFSILKKKKRGHPYHPFRFRVIGKIVGSGVAKKVNAHSIVVLLG